MSLLPLNFCWTWSSLKLFKPILHPTKLYNARPHSIAYLLIQLLLHPSNFHDFTISRIKGLLILFIPCSYLESIYCQQSKILSCIKLDSENKTPAKSKILVSWMHSKNWFSFNFITVIQLKFAIPVSGPIVVPAYYYVGTGLVLCTEYQYTPPYAYWYWTSMI